MDPANVPAKFEVRSFTHSWDNSGYWKTLGTGQWLDTPFKVTQGRWFGTDRKCVCDFLLDRHIVTLVLSCTVSEILQDFCAPEWPHPYSTLTFGVFPLHQIAHVGVSPAVKLFSKYSNMCEKYTSTSHTDGRSTYCGITALCVASRGKNASFKQHNDYCGTVYFESN